MNKQEDTLSRNFNDFVSKNEEVVGKDVIDNEMKFHVSSGHRKDILNDLHGVGIFLSKSILRSIIDKCNKCREYDKKRFSFKGFKETFEVGEIVGMDTWMLLKVRKC